MAQTFGSVELLQIADAVAREKLVLTEELIQQHQAKE